MSVGDHLFAGLQPTLDQHTAIDRLAAYAEAKEAEASNAKSSDDDEGGA